MCPASPGYEAARRPLHDTIDPRPAMVVEARGAADVPAAVVAARDSDVPLGVQATGHGTHVPADGAILVRTSDMATVLVDPDRRVARVGPGRAGRCAHGRRTLRPRAAVGLLARLA